MDGQLPLRAHFPDPAEQAEALLETCEGDIHEAKGIAATNYKFANYPADRLYWSRVEVLISAQEPAGVIERLASSKLRRNAVHS